ncbi:MAG: hypothetical protein R2724_18490, partial [Bryobacterales bacterium]
MRPLALQRGLVPVALFRAAAADLEQLFKRRLGALAAALALQPLFDGNRNGARHALAGQFRKLGDKLMGLRVFDVQAHPVDLSLKSLPFFLYSMKHF